MKIPDYHSLLTLDLDVNLNQKSLILRLSAQSVTPSPSTLAALVTSTFPLVDQDMLVDKDMLTDPRKPVRLPRVEPFQLMGLAALPMEEPSVTQILLHTLVRAALNMAGVETMMPTAVPAANPVIVLIPRRQLLLLLPLR